MIVKRRGNILLNLKEFAKNMSTIDDTPKRRSSINSDFDSDVEIRGLEGREPYSKPIKAIRRCMAGIVRFSITDSLYQDMLRWSIQTAHNGREEQRLPERCGLLSNFNILEDHFKVIDHYFHDACLNALDRKVWGSSSLQEYWHDLENRLDYTGFVRSEILYRVRSYKTYVRKV